MNLREMYLVLLIEESEELAQRATKILRFGSGEVQPGQELTNELRLINEFHDLIAVAMEVFDERDPTKLVSMELIETKREKIKKYLDYSIQCGTLNSFEDGSPEIDGGNPSATKDQREFERSAGTIKRLSESNQVSARKVSRNRHGQSSAE
jgi:hypothetical protein